MRKVYQIEANCKRAIVRYNSEYREYCVKFYFLRCNGWQYHNDADYFTDDLQDAIGTAGHFVNN